MPNGLESTPANGPDSCEVKSSSLQAALQQFMDSSQPAQLAIFKKLAEGPGALADKSQHLPDFNIVKDGKEIHKTGNNYEIDTSADKTLAINKSIMPGVTLQDVEIDKKVDFQVTHDQSDPVFGTAGAMKVDNIQGVNLDINIGGKVQKAQLSSVEVGQDKNGGIEYKGTVTLPGADGKPGTPIPFGGDITKANITLDPKTGKPVLNLDTLDKDGKNPEHKVIPLTHNKDTSAPAGTGADPSAPQGDTPATPGSATKSIMVDGQPLTSGSDGTLNYTVKQDDNLWDISQKIGAAEKSAGYASDPVKLWLQMESLNAGTNPDPNLIYKDQVLKVPAPVSAQTGS